MSALDDRNRRAFEEHDRMLARGDSDQFPPEPEGSNAVEKSRLRKFIADATTGKRFDKYAIFRWIIGDAVVRGYTYERIDSFNCWLVNDGEPSVRVGIVDNGVKVGDEEFRGVAGNGKS